MSIPALRQPKLITQAKNKTPIDNEDFLIISLRDGKKLVVTSDSYHGIITSGELYRCVFCETEMLLDVLCKERHKTSQYHRKILENNPHVNDFKENLIRKLSSGEYYCTICNVIVQSNFLHKHLVWETHTREYEKAVTRANSYKPTSNIDVEFPPLPNNK